MQLAQERLGVPKVVQPRYMASADLDNLSCMTYLSYFMKTNACGYKATLRDVNKILAPDSISNFVVCYHMCEQKLGHTLQSIATCYSCIIQSDWKDGLSLCKLVSSVGGQVKGWPDVPTFDPVHCTKLGT